MLNASSTDAPSPSNTLPGNPSLPDTTPHGPWQYVFAISDLDDPWSVELIDRRPEWVWHVRVRGDNLIIPDGERVSAESIARELCLETEDARIIATLSCAAAPVSDPATPRAAPSLPSRSTTLRLV